MSECVSGPLNGLRVIEFAHVAAGPFAAMLLGDLGADVLKVEPPSGDPMRQWPPFVGDSDEGVSLNFASVNRNKRNVIIDLKSDEGLSTARSLINEADVLIENYRPGAMDRLGLGYEDVGPSHPRGIIYCSINGYGADNQRSKIGAYDVIIQAESGLMSITGESDGPPVKCGVPVGDFVAGLYATQTILAALHKRNASGSSESVQLDCSMLHCLLAISALQTSEYWGNNVNPRRLGTAHPRNAPYQAFPASDSVIVVAAGNDSLWHKLCRLMGMESLILDERFETQTLRATHQETLYKILAPVFSSQTAAYWLDRLAAAGVPSGRVNTYAEVLQDQDTLGEDFIVPLPLPNGRVTRTTRYPVRSSAWRPRVPEAPPALNAGSASEALAAWGLDSVLTSLASAATGALET